MKIMKVNIYVDQSRT